MKRFWIALCLLGSLAWTGLVLGEGEVDCDKQSLDDGEALATYLKEYAEAEKCIGEKLNSLSKKYEVTEMPGAPKLSGEQIRNRMLQAWDDIAAAFDKLAAEAPDSDARMRSTYIELAKRAKAAGTELRSALNAGVVPDNSPFGHDSWKIPSRLLLPANKDLPLLLIGNDLNVDCSVKDSPLCKKTLSQGRDLMLHWKLADRISADISHGVILLVARQVEAKDALWNQYLYDSKPMLPFDFMITDWMTGGWSKSDQFPEGFRAPPDTQWFLLHPSFGVEYASAAHDGEQMKPILYIELIGANKWNEKDRWLSVAGLRYLSGFSLIASYADRDGVKDAGYGGLFTFNNVYSIGLTRYGSDTGVFFSLDMANLFRNKYKPAYQKYKEKFMQ